MQDGPPATCTPAPEICNDNIDNDCDGNTDCFDPDCSGIGACPVCGDVMHTEPTPLALPDGAGAGPPYTQTVEFSGFGQNQTYVTGNILEICVNMEHSYLRDLEIAIYAPSPTTGEYSGPWDEAGNDSLHLTLSQQLGNTGGEVYLGEANDNDDAENPVPGVGEDYCWSPSATKEPWIPYINDNFPTIVAPSGSAELPPSTDPTYGGDYMVAGDNGLVDNDWSPLVGAPMNGGWTIFVQDKWGQDNGFVFSWSITFDPTSVETCSTPPIQ